EAAVAVRRRDGLPGIERDGVLAAKRRRGARFGELAENAAAAGALVGLRECGLLAARAHFASEVLIRARRVLQLERENAAGAEGVFAGDRVAEEQAVEVDGSGSRDGAARFENQPSDGGGRLRCSGDGVRARELETVSAGDVVRSANLGRCGCGHYGRK